ncbi:MAG TPA: hypothetical protein VIF83_04460 [Gemmatimonadaceae bacterium]
MTMVRRGSLTLLLLLTACAGGAPVYRVAFRAEGPLQGSAVPRGKTVYVVPNGEVADASLERDLRHQIELALQTKGYVLAPPETADMYVLATFGVGMQIVASMEPMFLSPPVRLGLGRGARPMNDRIQYVDILNQQFNRWMLVIASDAEYYRRTGNIKNLWRGQATSQSKTADLRGIAAYLLVPAMNYFGKGTAKPITVSLTAGDIPRTAALKQ